MLTEGMKILADVVVQAGCIARRAWVERALVVGQTTETRASETMDFFTTLDPVLDDTLAEGVFKQLDVDRFLTEEGAKNRQRNYQGGLRAVIDSLDGSSNFATYRPDWAVSVAIEEAGVPQIGCIFAPVRGELVIAGRGEGTWLIPCYGRTRESILVAIDRGEAERVTTKSFALPNKKRAELGALKTSRIYVHTGKRRNFELPADDPFNTLYAKLANPGCTFCCTVALVEVALGKLDGAAIGFQNHWDYAAGRLIVTEAGGRFGGWHRAWRVPLGAEDFAAANASKTVSGDEWLAHIIAAGDDEVFEALAAHFADQALTAE